jgi:TetR/AcrR family transcriptional repressor of lmrAB and yxaGH operons
MSSDSYHGTALHDILDMGGSPRGSLYFHFPKGKEEIGEAALTLAAEAVRRAIAKAAETPPDTSRLASDIEIGKSARQLDLARLLEGRESDHAQSALKTPEKSRPHAVRL